LAFSTNAYHLEGLAEERMGTVGDADRYRPIAKLLCILICIAMRAGDRGDQTQLDVAKP
jgi:hypothetical protein